MSARGSTHRVQGRIQDFLQGGGGGGQRRPCTARADGGSRVDKHQIKVHSVHRIFRAILFVLFVAIVKKFVDNKKWWSRAGGGGVTTPPWIRAWGVLSRRQPASSKSDPHVHCRENKRTVYRGKSQKRNKKEFVGKRLLGSGVERGASAPGPRARARATL